MFRSQKYLKNKKINFFLFDWLEKIQNVSPGFSMINFNDYKINYGDLIEH